MITGIDNAVARVLETLKAKGLDQNTIIVYSADNGFMMGDRKTAGKWNHYEQSLSVPLIIYDPTLPESRRGHVETRLVSNIDIAPTFVELAGVDVPSVYQGLSLVPLLEGNAATWRKEFFCEHLFKHYNNWHAVRGSTYKYATYYDDDYEALYDLEKDPTELNNLATNPEYASVLSKMKERMNRYLTAYPKAEPGSKKVKAPNGASAKAKAADEKSKGSAQFERRDKNKDGKLSYEEFIVKPERDNKKLKAMFERKDTNQDSYLTVDDFLK